MTDVLKNKAMSRYPMVVEDMERTLRLLKSGRRSEAVRMLTKAHSFAHPLAGEIAAYFAGGAS